MGFVALLIVIYLIFRPDLINRISRFKVGDFEVELRELKREIEEGNEKIIELQDDIENEKRQFNELLNKIDANVPLNELAVVRQSIKSQSRNISDIDIFRQYLKPSSKQEELYATAVSIREKRPVQLLPDIISLLDNLADDKKLRGFRLNTIWTLTSSIHRILISCIRDGVKPFPNIDILNNAELSLKKLEEHPKVIADRPDDPMRGIRGPIKHSLGWIQKGKEIINNSKHSFPQAH